MLINQALQFTHTCFYLVLFSTTFKLIVSLTGTRTCAIRNITVFNVVIPPNFGVRILVSNMGAILCQASKYIYIPVVKLVGINHRTRLNLNKELIVDLLISDL